MKKIILRFFFTLFLIVSFFIIFMSTVGVETNRFNNQIGSLIKNSHKDLEIDLKKVKITLDPIKFELNIKTVGPNLKINDEVLELENIKTQISIFSFIKKEFSVKKLDISTKSVKINDLISFIRNLKNTPELFLLEKVFKKGYLISDIRLEFDDNGKIKNNYRINGLLKDSQIILSKRYNFDKIDLLFNFENNKAKVNDIKFLLNNTQFISKKFIVTSQIDNFFIEGSIENQKLSLEDSLVENFIKSNFTKLEFENLSFNSKNEFSFTINKKFKIKDIKLSSEIGLSNLKLVNKLDLKKIFPNIKNEINFDNHIINIQYDEKILLLNGNGSILFQNKKDLITYNLKKKNDYFDFESNLLIKKNPLVIDLLGYKKVSDTKADINIKGSHSIGKKTIIESLSLTENENKMSVDKLILDNSFKITEFKKINLDYSDEELRKNKLIVSYKNDEYQLIGPKFNANNLIDNLINNNSKNFKIFGKEFNFDIKIDSIYLDKKHVMNGLVGKLKIKGNEIYNAKLDANFPMDKKFKLTINSNQQEKITTLYLDQAEPILKRYKFIKGFKNGSLDFYSLKKNGKSISNLKIYDFRLKELPVLAKLLTLASLQGISDILSGEGITFDEFEMNFNNVNNLMTIEEMYTIGPAISILMDGYVEKNKQVSLRGSLVPATTINKFIANIPILGKILVGSKTGEGVFGVSFKIKGPPKDLETTVNPIKTLTPRFISRTLEKIKQ